MPHSAEAEAYLLGAILCGHRTAPKLLDSLREADFFLPANRFVFSAVRELRDSGRSFDTITVLDHLGPDASEHVGATIRQLVYDPLQEVQPENYVRLIREKAEMRRLIHAAQKLQDGCFSGKMSVTRLADGGIESLSEVLRASVDAQDSGITFFDAAKNVVHELDAPDVLRIRTGIARLDELTGGLKAGWLSIIASPTGYGKTLLSLQVQATACKDGLHALFASGEMSSSELLMRELATVSRVDRFHMQSKNRVTPDEVKRLIDACGNACKRCRVLDGVLSMERIRRAATQMKQAVLNLVVVDYDSLIEADGENEFEKQRNVVLGCKRLAQQLDCSVILNSQFNKAPGQRDHNDRSLDGLYGSAAKANYASLVLFIERKAKDEELPTDEEPCIIRIKKHRHGKSGPINAIFNRRTLRFSSATGATL